MGHDISAYLGRVTPTDLEAVANLEELTEEIAYLRGAYGLYAALDAQFYDGKVSGIGIGRWFTREHLRRALRRLWLQDRGLIGTKVTWRVEDRWRKSRHTVKPAIRFVQGCLDQLPLDQDAVYILFG